MRFCEQPDTIPNILKNKLGTSLKKSVQDRNSNRNLEICRSSAYEFLFRCPHNIQTKNIEEQCYNNKNTDGLYWGYFESRNDSTVSLIYDRDEVDRELLIGPQTPSNSRFILSCLVLDWQQHYELLENVVRYVVEGLPRAAIIASGNMSRFEIQYLATILSSHGTRYQIYTSEDASIEQIPVAIHNLFIFDPSFEQAQIVNSLSESQFTEDQSAIFFSKHDGLSGISFSRYDNNSVSATYSRKVQAMLYEHYNNGSWSNSFWKTFDVVQCGKSYGWRIEHLYSQIKAFSSKKVLGDGSYDNVLGATCALLKLYFWIGDKDTRSFSKTKAWLLNEYDSVDNFSKAVTLEALLETRVISIDNEKVISLLEDIRENYQREENTLVITKYITLATKAGNVELAHNAFEHLLKMNPTANMYHKAERCIMAIDISKLNEQKGNFYLPIILSDINYITHELDKLNSDTPLNVSAVSRALQAILKFDSIVNLPNIDWIDSESRKFSESMEVSDRSKMYDKAVSLQEKVNELKLIEPELRIYRLSVLLIIIPLSMAFGGYYMFEWLFDTRENFKAIYKTNGGLINLVSLPIVGLTVISYIALTKKWKLLPDWMRKAISFTQLKVADLFQKTKGREIND